MNAHTPGPWSVGGSTGLINQIGISPAIGCAYGAGEEVKANARLIAAAPELLVALKEARRAIGDHYAPNDCYATGPMTGDHIRDLVQCPTCSTIAMYDAAITKATGAAP